MIAKEFSRFASNYDRVNIIQKQVALELVAKLNKKAYPSILDLGCGSGEIYKNLLKNSIAFEHFVGVDIAPNMLDIHPKEARVELQNIDFNDASLAYNHYDVVLSSSALQWAKDLDQTLANVSKLSQQFYFAIFTSNTFKSLHQVAGISSPIYDQEILQTSIDRYYEATYTTKEYKLYFDSTYEMLRYIKGSGVSGGERKLSYKQIKELMEHYPLKYLEFEVLFVEAKSENSN